MPAAIEIDARARREALDTRRSLLLQAPAGSGKTTVLTARFLALLAVADAPEQILAITFTRKAAAEMRHRILAALQAAERGGSIAGIDASLLQAARERDRRAGWQLSRNAARLRVETIDALCHQLASALPVSARSGARLDITPTPELLYRRAARRTLQEALREPGERNAARLLLERLDNSWERIERLLGRMLAQRSHWLPRVLDTAEGSLLERIARGLAAELRARLAGAAAGLPVALLHEAERLLDELNRAPGLTLNAEPPSVPRWRALCDLAMTAKGDWRRSLVGQIPPGNAALRERISGWIAALERHAQSSQILREVQGLPDPALAAADCEALEALTQLLTRAAAELQLLFAEHGRVDYPYVSAAARQALSEQGEPSDFALRTGAAIRHILMDEFQDTSLEQFDLLRLLTAGWERGDGHTLFIVGDPMQSIYQFREAEVGLFLRARDHGIGPIGLETLQLRRNFRSQAPLIAWVNERFAGLFPSEDDARLAAVRYLPSVPAAPSRAAEGEHEGLGSGVSLHRVDADDIVGEAARVAQIVREARAQAPAASIAVLVAARDHAAEIVARLRAAGFVPRGVDLEPLRDRAVVRDLSALARVLLHAGDHTAWLALLRAPWCGLSLAELEALAELLADDGFMSLRARAAEQDSCGARLARICAALEPVMLGPERSWPLWQRVERSWLRLAGPAVYADETARIDAHRFIDALAAHEEPDSLVGESLAALIEDLYSTGPAQPGAVEVMTMHAAKGLEWDVVILPGLGRKPAPDADPLLHWIELPHAREGRDLLLAPIRAADQDDGSLADYIKGLKRRRQRLERARQLYVACTRARKALHLLGACPAGRTAGQIGRPVTGSLLEVLWPAINVEFSLLPSASPPAVSGICGERLGAPELRRLPANWSLPAPPTPLHASRLLLSAPASIETPEYSWVGLAARAIGTIVHAELRRLAATSLLPQAQDLQRRAAYYGEWLSEFGVPATEQAVAQARILEALERTLGDARGRWLLSAGHPLAQSEWRLSGLHEGRVVSVVFDRMLIDEHGQRWIVDYKTSRHEGGALESFIDSEAERYAPQLRRYAVLAAGLGSERVRVALYFPLLSVFRELTMAELRGSA